MVRVVSVPTVSLKEGAQKDTFSYWEVRRRPSLRT